MAVNENLYNWMNKTQGMKAAEWYRNNPTKPHTSNPFVNVNDAKWFPQASIEDPQKQNVASVQDPYRQGYADSGLNSSASETTPKLESGKYGFVSEQDLKNLYPNAAYKQLEIPKYADIELTQYGMGYSEQNSGSHHLFSKFINSPEFRGLESKQTALWDQGQELAKPYSSGEKGAAGLKIVDFEGYSKVADQYNRLMEERSGYASQQRALAGKYNQQYSGQALPGWENVGYYADVTFPEQSEGSDDSLIAAQYGDGFPKQPAWMKQIEAEYNKTKGKPLSPGTPKPGRGMGDVWGGPVRDASAPQDTDYSIATALSGSDEQRQQQTFRAEFDPQKAQTATAAAKAYKKSASTEDPFRSQAVFG